jgi:phosphate acyltransferase
MKIALDVMGGDHGPAPAIEGALQAAQECDVEVLLVGDEAIITAECRRLGYTDSRLSIRHASQVVEMHESPATVARKKRNSSIWIATELVKRGEASAVVSPGNTGASMVASFFVLGLTKGVERPAIATSLPTLTGTAIMWMWGPMWTVRPSIWPNSPSWGTSTVSIFLGSLTHALDC